MASSSIPHSPVKRPSGSTPGPSKEQIPRPMPGVNWREAVQQNLVQLGLWDQTWPTHRASVWGPETSETPTLCTRISCTFGKGGFYPAELHIGPLLRHHPRFQWSIVRARLPYFRSISFPDTHSSKACIPIWRPTELFTLFFNSLYSSAPPHTVVTLTSVQRVCNIQIICF
jgi:hypothetical protein